MKLQIKEQQEEVLRLKTEFTKTSNENNPKNILKTGKAYDGNKRSENIETYSYVKSISFKSEGEKCEVINKTNKS